MRSLEYRSALVFTCGLVIATATPADGQSSLNILDEVRLGPDEGPAAPLNVSLPGTVEAGVRRLPSVPVAIPAARPIPSRVRNVIGFFGSPHAADTLRQMPQRPSLASRRATPILPKRPASKPFTEAAQRPTVSPYLNLYREQDAESLPNYFAFVRPQLQQQRASRRQQAELHRLRGQIQRVSYDAAQPGTYGAMPATGHRARYLDTAQFYSGFSR